MSKNKEKIKETLSATIKSHAEFGRKKFISIFTPDTKPNLDCVNCAAPPECRGQSPKKWPCSKFEPRK